MGISRFGWVAAAALPLAACGGSGSDSTPTPPITLKGAAYWLPGGAVNQAELRALRGGAGADLGNVVYVEEGVIEFLGDESRRLDEFTIEFRDDEGRVAFVTAPPGFESTRLIRLEYVIDGVTYASEGAIGRFTSTAQMEAARGTATYFGESTASARYARRGSLGPAPFDLLGGDATVVVDFDAGTVRATLDDFGAAGAVAPIDRIVIDGMGISGNEFSGGALTASKNGVAVPAFASSGAQLASSGVFTGWNDTNGGVAGGNRPGEVGGAFVAEPVGGTLVGRYAAD